jgi:hypothetical protein
VSFNVKKGDLCSDDDEEEDEEEDDQNDQNDQNDRNDTLQATGQPDSELNKSTAEKRSQALQRARFARRKRKRRKSQLKNNSDKVGCYLFESAWGLRFGLFYLVWLSFRMVVYAMMGSSL